MIQFQTTIIYSSVGEEGEIKTKLYIKSAALQTNMRSSIGLTPLPSHNTDGGKGFLCVSVCVCLCVYVYCMCALSAAGQCAQRGVAVQAAVSFRGHGGVTARVSGLCGHGRDVVGWGGGGGRGLRGAVDHCCTCAAKNTRQRIGFIEIHSITAVTSSVTNSHVYSAWDFRFLESNDVVTCSVKLNLSVLFCVVLRYNRAFIKGKILCYVYENNV